MKKITHFYLTVAIALHVKGTFTYLLPEDPENNVAIGCRVLVPFRGRRVTGYVIEKKTETEIAFMSDPPVIVWTVVSSTYQ